MIYESPSRLTLIIFGLIILLAIIGVVIQGRDERKRRDQEEITARAGAEYERWKKDRGLL